MSGLSFDEADRLKKLEQDRAHAYARELLTQKAYADQISAERLSALTAIREYGQATIKTLSVLNGGAILALLAFTGAFFTRNDRVLADVGVSFARSVSEAFVCYGVGLVCAALTAGIGYLNYSVVAQGYMEPSEVVDWLRGLSQRERPRWHGPFATGSAWVAVLIATLGLGAFIWGSTLAVKAMAVLGA